MSSEVAGIIAVGLMLLLFVGAAFCGIYEALCMPEDDEN